MGRCGAGLRNRNTSHGRESAKSMISQNPPVSSPQCQCGNIWSLIDSLVLGGHQSQFSDTVQIGAKTVSRKLSVSATRLGRRVKTGRWSPGIHSIQPHWFRISNYLIIYGLILGTFFLSPISRFNFVPSLDQIFVQHPVSSVHNESTHSAGCTLFTVPRGIF